MVECKGMGIFRYRVRSVVEKTCVVSERPVGTPSSSFSSGQAFDVTTLFICQVAQWSNVIKSSKVRVCWCRCGIGGSVVRVKESFTLKFGSFNGFQKKLKDLASTVYVHYHSNGGLNKSGGTRKTGLFLAQILYHLVSNSDSFIRLINGERILMSMQ
jgi:hypothetical protein